jgi:hypothetical protein
MSDLAERLEAGIEAARQHQANVEKADELALRVAAHEAGVPLDHPVAALFLNQYTGRPDPDEIVVAWHRQVLGKEPPAAVVERLAEAEAEARIARYRAALEHQPEESS